MENERTGRKTPYAFLLVKPSDDDLTIRKRFHELSKGQHPDRPGAGGVRGPLWQPLVDAYGQVKTVGNRTAWHRAQSQLARLCASCSGNGVTWKRVGRDKGAVVCSVCDGEGRVKR